MYSVSVEQEFDAAHYLRGYRGKCEALHGHRFRVAVTVKASALDDIGLAYDFTDLKGYLRDILSRFDTLKLCVAYELDGQRVEAFPTDLTVLARCQPIYETLPGWGLDIASALTFDDLPQAARDYVGRVETILGIPASCISVGPGRDQTIRR